MKKIIYTTTGVSEVDVSLTELKELAKQGNVEAIRELVQLKGGWSALSSLQKEKVTQLVLGFEVDL